MSLKCILYVSQSLIRADRDDFRAAISKIMMESERNNRADDITGVLAYDRGRFLQYIEGPPGPMGALVDRLLGDPRHTNMTIRIDEPVETRLFPKWSMALLNITLPPLPGYSVEDLENQPVDQLLARLQRAADEESILSVAPRSQDDE
ncbi:hypothetical protein GCM10011367_09110 [Marinicauda pacifica]|uniref:BLUF domain-containing protein n=1 Tax=Marinicauda pacifica TaxID=1133559 RepID=A0A4S2HFX9_9PROT|nr:BLUF domain-containing protein [Marinicauda pacifica]TGY94562.1 BLUF domain-containing protein [Marinicauda pacifica]GGE36894.1 hypothetical protein GCM10011367_09110 [Marinicauda pacifica]